MAEQSESIPSKQQIVSGLPYFLIAKDEHDFVYSAILTLHRPVDGDSLSKAVNLASKRYPYLRMRPVKSFTGIELEQADEMIACIETPNWVPLNSDASHHYLLAVTYHDKTIRVEFFRGLCSRKGIYPFLKTVIYYYFTLLKKEEQKIENVRLTDTPMSAAEYFDPYSEDLPEHEEKDMKMPKQVKALKLLKLGLVKKSEMYVRRIWIQKNVLEKYLESVHGSEKSFLLLEVFKAVNSAHFSEKAPVVGSACADMSRVLRASSSIIHPSHFLSIVYDQELKEEDSVEAQHRIIRQRLKELSDYDNIYPLLAADQAIHRRVNKIPMFALRQAVMKSWISKCNSWATFFINFEDGVDLGSCNKYIKEFYIEPYIGMAELFIDATTFKDEYVISWYQQWTENLYFDAFCRELEMNKIKYEIGYQGKLTSTN